MGFKFLLGFQVDPDDWCIRHIGGLPGGHGEMLWQMSVDEYVDASLELESAMRETRQIAKLLQAMKLDGATIEQMKYQLEMMKRQDA